MKFFVSAILLWFSVSLFADIIYETDYKENPTGTTTSSNKGSFTTSMPSWGEGFSSAYLTGGSSGECTITFSKPIDLTSYEDVKITIQYGSPSSRPLVININNTGDKTIHTMASSAERNVVITVSTDITANTISSILVKSSGGGNVYFFHIAITGTSSKVCPEGIVGDTTAYFLKGQSITVWGETFTTEATRQKTYKTSEGCDSLVTLYVKETSSGSITNKTICEGETYTWDADGKTYSQTTNISVIKKNQQGTDSICMLHLIVNPILRTTETHTMGEGETYTWNGKTYDTPGDYTYQTSSVVTGCDSIVALHLIKNTPTDITTTICKGDTFYWYINGTLYSKYTSSKNTSTTQGGIKYSLHLTVQEPSYTEYTYRLDLTKNEQYTWNGKTYSTPGIYFDTTQVYDDSGCPKQIDYLVLNGDTAASTCDGVPFCWDRTGESTTSNTTKTYKFPSIKINGNSKYASIVNTITKGTTSYLTTDTTIFVGDTCIWLGKKYTKQGTYYDVSQNASGCDLIGTLHLGVCKQIPDTGFINATINDGESFYWSYRNTSYTSNKRDTVQFLSSFGCDTVVVLNLSVQPSPSGKYRAETICDGDAFDWHGHTYTEAGTYRDGDSTLMLGVLPNPQISVCPDQIVNWGKTAQLSASGAEYYAWEPIDYLSSKWSDLPIYTPGESTMYHVKSYNSAAANAVYNGDFELGQDGCPIKDGGTESTFETDGFWSTAGGTYGKYIIAKNAKEMGWNEQNDHTTGDGTGYFMIMDGFQDPNKIIWQQKVKVTPHTDYIFSAWFISLHSSFNRDSYTQFQFFVNGTQLGDVAESPHKQGQWGRYYELWDSEDNEEAILTIMDQNTNDKGNDFGLDDISFQALGPCWAEDSVKVTVNFNIDLYPDCNHTIDTRLKDSKTHQVTFTTDGVTCAEQCGYYKKGDQLTVTVHDTDECYGFKQWSDGKKDNPRIFIMGEEDFTVTPEFGHKQYTITLKANPIGGGKVGGAITKSTKK